MALGSDNHAYSGQGGQTDGQVDEDVKGQMAREHGSHQIQDGQTNGQVNEQVKGQITKDQEAIEDKVDHLSILSILFLFLHLFKFLPEQILMALYDASPGLATSSEKQQFDLIVGFDSLYDIHFFKFIKPHSCLHDFQCRYIFGFLSKCFISIFPNNCAFQQYSFMCTE